MSSPAQRAVLRPALEVLVLARTGATALARLCPRCGSAGHGRPLLLGVTLHVSLAYAEGLGVAVWSPDPIGVDVEVDGAPVAGVGGRVAWTRTEAVLKATGQGLAALPRDLADLPRMSTEALGLPPGWVGTVAVDAAVASYDGAAVRAH